MKTMFGVTRIQTTGLRALMWAPQGRNMIATREEAEERLRDVLANNDEHRLEMVFGKQAIGTFRVDAFECYDHGDPVSIYVDEEV